MIENETGHDMSENNPRDRFAPVPTGLTPEQMARYDAAYEYQWARLTVPPYHPSDKGRGAWDSETYLFCRAYALSDATDLLLFRIAYDEALWRSRNPNRPTTQGRPDTVDD